MEAFPSRAESNFDFLFSRLKSLEDDAFEWVVLNIVDTVTKLYPDDNLIAMIRERANLYELQRKNGLTPIITDERWEAPPEEWERLKKKLGLEIKNAS